MTATKPHSHNKLMLWYFRCAYVLNFKHAACIAEERSMGFTHSHNESLNWDKFQAV